MSNEYAKKNKNLRGGVGAGPQAWRVIEGGKAEGRVPPYSAEAEECLLGCCFVDPEAGLRRCAEAKLRPGAFYVPANKIIFEVMLSLQKRDIPIDMAVVAEEVRSSGNLDAVGGLGYLARVGGNMPTTVQLPYFISKLRELWGLRTMIECATDMVERCYGYTGEMRDLVSGLRNRLENMFEWADTSASDQASVAAAASAKLEDMLAGRVDVSRQLTLGIPGFDALFTPIDPNNEEWLIILAGLRSQGKSSLARQIALANVLRGKRGIVFNLETGNRGWLHRAAALKAGVNYRGLEVATREQKQALRDGMADMGALVGRQVWVFEDIMEIGDIEHKVREIHRATPDGIHFIVVDYLQLVELRDARRGANREQIIAEISRRFKRLGKKLNIACIVLAQFGRSPAKEGRRPILADLRESGSIENDADKVLALWMLPEDRNGIAQDESTSVPLMQLIQLKNRNGPCGHEDMVFIKRLTKFDVAPARAGARPGAPKPEGGYKGKGGAK